MHRILALGLDVQVLEKEYVNAFVSCCDSQPDTKDSMMVTGQTISQMKDSEV